MLHNSRWYRTIRWSVCFFFFFFQIFMTWEIIFIKPFCATMTDNMDGCFLQLILYIPIFQLNFNMHWKAPINDLRYIQSGLVGFRYLFNHDANDMLCDWTRSTCRLIALVCMKETVLKFGKWWIRNANVWSKFTFQLLIILFPSLILRELHRLSTCPAIAWIISKSLSICNATKLIALN